MRRRRHLGSGSARADGAEGERGRAFYPPSGAVGKQLRARRRRLQPGELEGGSWGGEERRCEIHAGGTWRAGEEGERSQRG